MTWYSGSYLMSMMSWFPHQCCNSISSWKEKKKKLDTKKHLYKSPDLQCMCIRSCHEPQINVWNINFLIVILPIGAKQSPLLLVQRHANGRGGRKAETYLRGNWKDPKHQGGTINHGDGFGKLDWFSDSFGDLQHFFFFFFAKSPKPNVSPAATACLCCAMSAWCPCPHSKM